LSAPLQRDGAGLGSQLGARLKERRRELGRKLAEVAEAAEVSIGYLSAIEKGTSVPSLPVLARLSHALELSLAEMLRSSSSERLARGRLSNTLGAKRLAAAGSRLQIVRSVRRPGDAGPAPVTLGRSDVFVFVHDGGLEIEVDGATFALAAGDALHCDLPQQVDWRVLGEKRAVSLWAAGRATRAR
jgi:transcriptional regulator with XRE-family HTH domain